MSRVTGVEVGRTFSYFREALGRARLARRGEFIYALSKRHTIEWRSNGTLVGNLLLSDSEIDEIIASRVWDGSAADADEMVGDWLDEVLA